MSAVVNFHDVLAATEYTNAVRARLFLEGLYDLPTDDLAIPAFLAAAQVSATLAVADAIREASTSSGRGYNLADAFLAAHGIQP